MLIYGRTVAPKPPKRRSRAGCIRCKEKKKKCNEVRPQCDRCTERSLQCEYEPVKPRKRRLTAPDHSPMSALESFDESAQWYQQTAGEQCEYGIDEMGTQSDYGVNDLALDWDMASLNNSTSNSFPFASTDEIEEIIRNDIGPLVRSGRSSSFYPDLAMIAPSPIPSPLLEFSAPLFNEFAPQKNRRALVDHFCNVLSHLIVFKEDTGNPFRQLVLPLSHASSPVMNAIFALSSAHLEYRGVQNEEKSLDFHNRALQGLAQLIERNDGCEREEVLGAIMLLVYYEVLVQRGTSIVYGHLKGALTVMQARSQAPSATSMFLERAFRFYDVIAALSLGTSPMAPTSPLSSSQIPTSPTLPSPPPSASSPLTNVDTLLGMATDLWPIIHRLSHLRAAKQDLIAAEASGYTSKASVLRTELESTQQAIENALLAWAPPITDIQPPADGFPGLDDTMETEFANPGLETARLGSILANALAYRHSALLYLYRDIQSLPLTCPKVRNHTTLSLRACCDVVTWKGPMSALLWPLFVSACQALSIEDRSMARISFEGTERRQGMENIGRAWIIVQEVWRRGDSLREIGEGEVEWRDVAREFGFEIVFG